ncbi:MAG: polyhydroxyalkanoic acid system family protein [Candidatus Rokuibacteriota bacterium]
MQQVYEIRGPWDHGPVDVPLISLTIQHGRTQEEARHRLEAAVHEVSAKFGAMLRRVEWAADRNRVRLEGVGFWVEMWVDAQAVHATGDAPILGRLFGGPLSSRLKEIIEQTFQKQLP